MSLIHGFQAAGILSVVKHFPGHGDTALDSHYDVPVVNATYEELQKVHLAPFKEAVQQGVDGIMTGHVRYPALDNTTIATFSKPILHDLLREKMGFKGLLVTDSLDMKSATSFCTIAGCAVRALASGEDMILLGRYIKPVTVFNQITAEVKKQNLQPRVEEAAHKIFALKEKLGLLSDEPATPVPPVQKAYQAELTKISNQAVTLVRNDKNLIPFRPAKTAQKLTVCAVFFAPARFADQLPDFTEPFLANGWNVRSYNAALTPRKKDSERAAACAKGADLLVLTSLQWADKTNINQKNTISGLINENKNVVFISTMSPYDIPNYPEAHTVLATYGLNRHVLHAAADIILGNLQPKGKLPVLFNATSFGSAQSKTRTPQVKRK